MACPSASSPANTESTAAPSARHSPQPNPHPARNRSAQHRAWTDTFTDPRLCAAIVDRLTYNATIIETGTNSYRLAHTRARASVMG